MPSYQRRGKKFQVKWREGEHQRSHTVSTEKRAQEVIVEINKAHDLGQPWNPPSLGGDADGTPALTTLTTDYVLHAARYLSPGTLRNYAMHLDLFMRHVASTGIEDSPGSLSGAVVGGFYDALRLGQVTSKELKPQSAEKYIRTVEQAWDWASLDERYEDLVARPRKMKLATPPVRRTVAPTWEEMARVIDVARDGRRKLAWVLYATGLRVSQAMRLRWDDLDLDAGLLTIRPELGKSAAEKAGRVVPVAPVLLDEVRGWGVREGWLIPDVPGGKHSRDAAAREMAKLWRKTGVREEAWASPQHCFRRGFRTGLRRLGADPEAVEFLIGHSLGLVGLYQDPEGLPLREAVALVPDPREAVVVPLKRVNK